MLDKEEVQEAIDKFRKYVVQQSRSNLTKQKKNASKSLYNSIKGVSKVNPNSISLYFEMEEHGIYQDKGVKGKTSSTKAPNSPFKFGSGTGKKGGLTDGIQKWVKQKRFQFRDEQGRFMSYNSTAFLITRSIYNKGLKPSLFFTKPFEKAFDRLPDELVEAYGLDIEKLYVKK
jgi:hypothetical protein